MTRVSQLTETSLKNLKQGNKELVRGQEYNEAYGRNWSILFTALGIILLILHFIKA